VPAEHLVMTKDRLRSFQASGQDHEGTRGFALSIQDTCPKFFLSTFTVDSLVRCPLALPEVREEYGIATRSRKAASS